MFLRRIHSSTPIRLSAILLVLPFVLSGCATHTNLPVLKVGRNDPGVDRVHRLGIGDKLKINVFGESELSGDYEVDASGFIPFPLIGNVKAAGLSVHELQARLQRRLANGYLRRPRITVDITNYRPIYIHGEVRNGGEHPFKTGLKLRDAIALAGGYTYRADEAYVLPSRADRRETYRVMLPSNLRILPGDNIRIPERLF